MKLRLLLGCLVIAGGCDDNIYRTCETFTDDWEGVECLLDAHCISCHSEQHSNPPVVTVLPEDLYRDVLEGNGELVVPGDPAASKLWRVISGELGEGDVWGAMPWLAGETLPPESIDHVKRWIEAGAPIPDGGEE